MIHFEFTFDRFSPDLTHRFLIDFHFAQARWRVRSFAALWIRRARPYGLRMAYRVRYPNQPAYLPFLLIILPNFPDPKVIYIGYIQDI